jgi:hypothetical protein
MLTRNTESVRAIGQLTLVPSGALFLLYLGNLRSILYFGGPNWSFLLWLVAYSAFAGIGLY